MRGSIVLVALTFSLAAACGGGSSSDSPDAAAPDAGTLHPHPRDAGDPDTGDTAEDGGDDAGPIVDNGAPSEVYPAKHPTAPQIVNQGGSTMSAPQIIPVFFPNDALQTDLQDFTDTIGATAFFKATVTEYGVGAATGLPGILLTEEAPTAIDDSQIQDWLRAKLASKAAGFEARGPDLLYTVFYPATTAITYTGSAACTAFGAYHSSFTVDPSDTRDQPYAVIPRCASFDGLSGINAVTAAASHEIIEAATDPNPLTSPAYEYSDADHLIWTDFLGAEVSDLCTGFKGAFYKPDGYAYTVQRSWSNKLAAESHDPCAPNMPSEVYFNSAVVLPDKINVGTSNQVTIPAVYIPAGKSKTVEVDLFSDAKTSGPWNVAASNYPPAATDLTFAWDRTHGLNGEKLHLTITAKKAGKYGGSGFRLASSLGLQTNTWMGYVGN